MDSAQHAKFVRAVEAELARAEDEIKATFDRYMEEFFAELAAWEPKGLGPFLDEQSDGADRAD